MPARVQQSSEPDYDQLLLTVPRIFEQASTNSANHRKNYVALHKVQSELAKYIEELKKRGRVKLVGERLFQDAVLSSFARVIPLKKGESSGDRIVKFMGGYVKFINERAMDRRELEDDEDDETPESRFTTRLLTWLQGGFIAKDKNARYRVFQTLAETVSHLGEIDEDTYMSLREALIDRLNDKEWIVRYQVALSMAKLCVSEDVASLNGQESMLDILCDTMAQDSSPDVRRAVLFNIPIISDTRSLSAILDRTRDVDSATRKMVYEVLGRNVRDKTEEPAGPMGPTHPRVLTITQREIIVRNGLGDRESSVRDVAAGLLGIWVDACGVKTEGVEFNIGDVATEKVQDAVLAFLALFYLNDGSAIGVDALLSVFKSKPATFENVAFDDQYWANLTAEKAFLARVFVERCKETKDETRLESRLPVVTAIAFRVQESFNALVVDDGAVSIDANIDGEEKEFIMAELLRLAVNLDYTDEIGRRKMFQLVRDMLQKEFLPASLMGPCLDVMRVLSSSERDLIQLVVETVQELRDAAYDDDEVNEESMPKEPDPDASFDTTPAKPQPLRKSLDKMSEAQRERVNKVDLRCLSLCISTLERVNGTLEENAILDGVLRELIFPSVLREDVNFRENGLKCLGLCCLIAPPLALQTVNRFIAHISSPENGPEIRITLAESLFDILMVHDRLMSRNQPRTLDVLPAFIMTNIEKEQDPDAKAVFCKGATKLVFSGLVTDINVVKNLIKAYVSPSTADNQELRQCLAYFLPVYSHSSSENQKRMREIFIHVFLDICEDRKEAEKLDNEDKIISSKNVGDMFAEWTDPLRLSQALNANGTHEASTTDECVHLDLAEDILKTLFEQNLKVDIEKEDKRVLCQLLNKLYIPDTVDDYKIRSLKLLVDNLRSRRPPKDAASKTALSKFDATITKKFEKQLENFSEEEFRKFEELNELFQFLDSIIPLDDDDSFDLDAPRKGRKRRSESTFTTTTEAESRTGSPSRNSKEKRAAKRARFSTSDGGDDDVDQYTEKGSPAPPAAPTRTLPKRAAAGKKPTQPIIISSDSEGDEERTPAPVRNRSSRARYRPSVKEEAQIDKDIDDLLQSHASTSTSSTGTSEVPFDSIMDEDSDEEDEVNGLLAED